LVSPAAFERQLAAQHVRAEALAAIAAPLIEGVSHPGLTDDRRSWGIL
jgi:hypothetical protein